MITVEPKRAQRMTRTTFRSPVSFTVAQIKRAKKLTVLAEAMKRASIVQKLKFLNEIIHGPVANIIA